MATTTLTQGIEEYETNITFGDGIEDMLPLTF